MQVPFKIVIPDPTLSLENLQDFHLAKLGSGVFVDIIILQVYIPVNLAGR